MAIMFSWTTLVSVVSGGGSGGASGSSDGAIEESKQALTDYGAEGSKRLVEEHFISGLSAAGLADLHCAVVDAFASRGVERNLVTIVSANALYNGCRERTYGFATLRFGETRTRCRLSVEYGIANSSFCGRLAAPRRKSERVRRLGHLWLLHRATRADFGRAGA
jgi:hypothetical protein